MNSLRHGLTSQVDVLPTEDREAYDQFCVELVDRMNPATPEERKLARAFADDRWRLNRIFSIENSMFALGREAEGREFGNALADARTFQTHSKQFLLLSAYEQRIHGSMLRNLKRLAELEAARRAPRLIPLPPALPLR